MKPTNIQVTHRDVKIISAVTVQVKKVHFSELK